MQETPEKSCREYKTPARRRLTEFDLNEVKKPIICTPNSKRSREDDGNWESPRPANGEHQHPENSTAHHSKLQTYMNSFFVKQTPEERSVP